MPGGTLYYIGIQFQMTTLKSQFMFDFLFGMGVEDQRIYRYLLAEPKRAECFALSFEARKEGFHSSCNCIQIDKLRIKWECKLKHALLFGHNLPAN